MVRRMRMPRKDRDEFTHAIGKIRRYKPEGYQFILDNQQLLRSEFEEGKTVQPEVRRRLRANQLRSSGIYQSLKQVGRTSAIAGALARPCCSEKPFIWPFCNAEC